MPTPPLAAVSDAAHDSPAAPRSCTPTASFWSSSSRHASMRRFSSNGSPTCTDGRFTAPPSSKPADASTLAPPMPSRPVELPSSTARLPGPSARASTSRVDGQDAEAQHVHERVVAVGVVEHRLAADGRHAHRVAVAADARHDAFEQVARARVVERAEAQRVHQRDRPRAHREDVADDAADAGGRALVGLDRRRVVVALDAHRDREPVADVDHARALTRADEHPRRRRREAAEVRTRRLVGAVLRPHHRVHRELEVGRLAAELARPPRPARRRSSRAAGAAAVPSEPRLVTGPRPLRARSRSTDATGAGLYARRSQPVDFSEMHRA